MKSDNESHPLRVLVLGAHGRTGQRIIRLLRESPHHPIALVRSMEQRHTFDRLGVPTVFGDLEYPVDHAFQQADAVIFAAGSGSHTGKDKTLPPHSSLASTFPIPSGKQSP